MVQPKILFICKRRSNYHQPHPPIHDGVSTGLLNSARFVSDMLVAAGIEAKTVVVNDNNDIDREVRAYGPSHVIIEALWVVPEKFNVLTKIYPHIKWIVRYHSEIPFVAGEGIAMRWLFEMLDRPNVAVSGNSRVIQKELEFLVGHHFHLTPEEVAEKVIFLPNYYDIEFTKRPKYYDMDKDYISVGCFGAIRPLKNQLLQAVAALKFANSMGKKLKFHINTGRVEGNGSPVLRNLRDMFNRLVSNGHELVEHEWMPHEEFMEMLADEIDVGMQVSFSETFNIVAADMVSAGVPIVASDEVKWTSKLFNAVPTSSNSMARKLWWAVTFSWINVKIEQWFLKRYIDKTRRVWIRQFATKCDSWVYDID